MPYYFILIGLEASFDNITMQKSMLYRTPNVVKTSKLNRNLSLSLSVSPCLSLSLSLTHTKDGLSLKIKKRFLEHEDLMYTKNIRLF